MVSLSDLLQMDNTYLSRIKLRRQLMDDHPEATLACNYVAEPAALELYDWLVGTYLPKRFPTCFSLVTKHEATAAAESDSNNTRLTLLLILFLFHQLTFSHPPHDNFPRQNTEAPKPMNPSETLQTISGTRTNDIAYHNIRMLKVVKHMGI